MCIRDSSGSVLPFPLCPFLVFRSIVSRTAPDFHSFRFPRSQAAGSSPGPQKPAGIRQLPARHTAGLTLCLFYYFTSTSSYSLEPKPRAAAASMVWTPLRLSTRSRKCFCPGSSVAASVSYTHLDVYKRQRYHSPRSLKR